MVLKKTLKAVIKKAKARAGSNLGLAGFFFARVLPTGGPTASRACENWRIPGAGADPNPDEALIGFSTGSWRREVFPG